MTQSTLCPDCSEPLEDGARVCAACGWTGTPDPATTGGPSTTSAKQSPDDMILDDLRNETLGEYEILGELGRGGMATVYLAHDIALDRKVAIKLISPFYLGEDNAERFKLEARTAAGLSHPHIIPIYSVRETESLLFFVMKYIPGRTLESILKEGDRLSIPTIRVILTQAAEALNHAHRHSVVHRDVKPGNIMIDDDGWVIVTDFGIAKAAASASLTTTGTTVGTPTHMSPEQCLAQPVTGASDQYSLGLVGYEMVVGGGPFTATSPMSVMYAHLNETPRSPAERRSDCPQALADALMRMLAKEPDERFSSMTEAIIAIDAPPLQHDDPIRREMGVIARANAPQRTASFPSTPRSPIPITRTKRAPVSSPASATPEGRRPVDRKRWVNWARWTVPLVAAGIIGWFALLRPAAEAPSVVVPAAVEPVPEVPAAGQEGPLGMEAQPSDEVAPAISPPQPAAITQGPPPITTIAIRPSEPRVTAGETIPILVEAHDAAGIERAGQTISWRVTDESVATISRQGMLTGVTAGSTILAVSVDGVVHRTTVTVAPASVAAPAAVATVVVNPASVKLQVGETRQLVGTVSDSVGQSLDRPVTWTSSDQAVADVSVNGLVIARSSGGARISATVGDRSGVATVTVAAVVVIDPTPAPAPRTGIINLVHSYAAAIASEDVAAIRELYPSLPESSRRTWADLFANYDQIEATVVDDSIDIANAADSVVFELLLTLRNSREEQRIVLHTQTRVQPRDGVWHFAEVTQRIVPQ